jgi:diguanylate cyclase (GGDEF)-like protein
MQPAGHDPLTGLPGRAWLQDWLGRTIRRTPAFPVAALLLDLDNFRAVNDCDGYDHGDSLLLRVVERLRAALPEEAVLARVGGDEFCVLLPGVDADAARARAQLLRQAFMEPFELDGCLRYSSCSIGFALYPADAGTASSLVCRADMALHRAKSERRGGVCRFRAELLRQAEDHLEMQSLLRDALRAGNQLSLHFQPQFCLPSGHLHGVEALLRWKHPQRGDIPPSRFVPAAEAGGLIGVLGDWVLAEACRCAGILHDAGWPLRVAVNLSALQLCGNELPGRVRTELDKHALPPDSIEIELTESTVIENPEATAAVMRALADFGVRTTIDDFGTGFSSLSYLCGLPVSTIKIDRSFVRQLEESEKGRKLVQGLVRLAHSLDLAVVAEGVETTRQLSLLCGYGCDGFQGWLASKALPIASLCEFLSDYRPGTLWGLPAGCGEPLACGKPGACCALPSLGRVGMDAFPPFDQRPGCRSG